jgi:two-component system, chemotaxis family, CheB/CheR fusion protein
VWNLLSNAIKFTPTGGRVEIINEMVQQMAEIRVSDTGIGIRAELLPYVFDRFHQGDSSTTKAKQGLGLGLSIVRHIVELHGGEVFAASPGVGEGTTITVRLPLGAMLPKAPPSDHEPTAEDQNEVVTQEGASLKGLHILVVDDDADILELMKYILEDQGAEVVVVTSVREAIAALIAEPSRYNVLCADIGMADEDGFSLIRQVRAMGTEAGGQIPAVAITAYASDRERQQAMDAGFQMHMAKPVDPTQLIRAVATLIGRVREE